MVPQSQKTIREPDLSPAAPTSNPCKDTIQKWPQALSFPPASVRSPSQPTSLMQEETQSQELTCLCCLWSGNLTTARFLIPNGQVVISCQPHHTWLGYTSTELASVQSLIQNGRTQKVFRNIPYSATGVDLKAKRPAAVSIFN